jgi:5'(3')-deoxyribonucleotidase
VAKPAIFLDMDGVLCNFFHGALEACGLPADTPAVWDFWKPQLTTSQFWSAIDQQHYFWEDLELYPWALELVDVCRSLGDVYFCSSPGPDRDSASGKLAWLRRHNLLDRDGKYILTAHKDLLSSPGRVLIDDSVTNLVRWRSHGGSSLVFPMPWNSQMRTAEDPQTAEDFVCRLREKKDKHV